MRQLRMFDKQGRIEDEHSKVLEKVRVFDNRGKTFDRYFVVIDGEVYTMSRNPTSPQGMNQYAGPYDPTGLPRNSGSLGILLDHIPPEIEAAILERIDDRVKVAAQNDAKNLELVSSEYANFYGAYCPYCGSKRTEALGPVDLGDDGTGFQHIICKRCNKKWYDEYKLTGFRPSK